MNLLLFILENFLRFWGLFWIIGGLITIKTAREANFMDTVLEQLEEKKVDRSVSNFMFIGGFLTLFSGIGLLINNDWTLIILIVLIFSQWFYFGVKKKKLSQAKTEEEKQEYMVQPSTYNAYLTSIYITIVFIIKIIISRLITLSS